MQRPVVYHYDPVFLDEFARVETLLKQVYQTDFDVVIMQGEAVLALEAAAASIIRPGTTVLNVVSGVFAAGYAGWIERYGGTVVELRVSYDDAIDPEDVRAVLQQHPEIGVMSAVHCETPSGTMNPIRDICTIAHEFDVVTIVDTVSGLGAEDLSPESWGIDVAVAGPQKCLGGVPGLSLLAISPRAWEVMESVQDPLRGSYLSLLDWKTSWIEQGRFPYTPSVSDVHALESTLELAVAEGMIAMAARHQGIATAARSAVESMGLTLWPMRESIAAPGCTAVHVPDGATADAIISSMRNRFGVMISGGYGELSGRLVRLGHMGMSAHPTSLFAQLGVFESSLVGLGVKIESGAGINAAIDALRDWDDGNGSSSPSS
jgi:pyridoxamine--pyruvate transaminase